MYPQSIPTCINKLNILFKIKDLFKKELQEDNESHSRFIEKYSILVHLKHPDFQYREKITDGEYVAVMWIDQMWYRAKVRNFVNNGQLRVFYIDYGTTRVVR